MYGALCELSRTWQDVGLPFEPHDPEKGLVHASPFGNSDGYDGQKRPMINSRCVCEKRLSGGFPTKERQTDRKKERKRKRKKEHKKGKKGRKERKNEDRETEREMERENEREIVCAMQNGRKRPIINSMRV